MRDLSQSVTDVSQSMRGVFDGTEPPTQSLAGVILRSIGVRESMIRGARCGSGTLDSWSTTTRSAVAFPERERAPCHTETDPTRSKTSHQQSETDASGGVEASSHHVRGLFSPLCHIPPLSNDLTE
jgi:hypothetical protein